MVDKIFTIAFSLFLLMDSIGNIPIYLTILAEIDYRRRLWIITREMFIALIMILLFALFGDWLMEFLNITQETLYFAGGVILFIMALKMIFPERGSLLESLGIDGEPFIFPLAIPLVAGPAVLAAVMIYSAQLESNTILYLAIIIAWLVSTTLLLCSSYLQKWLGAKGIKAMERLMGLILMLIAINMLLQGVRLIQK